MPNQSRGIPPYIGWATWTRLIRQMKTFVPPKLDRSYFTSMGFSGTQYSQAVRALTFLSLMDESKRPTEELRQLVMGKDEERKNTLRFVIEKAYKPFFDNPGPLKATKGNLESFIRGQGAKGVLDKCVTFFISAAREAGIPISPHLDGELEKRAKRTITAKKKTSPSKQIDTQTRLPEESSFSTEKLGEIDLRIVSYLAGMPEEHQDRWIRAYLKLTKALEMNTPGDTTA